MVGKQFIRNILVQRIRTLPNIRRIWLLKKLRKRENI